MCLVPESCMHVYAHSHGAGGGCTQAGQGHVPHLAIGHLQVPQQEVSCRKAMMGGRSGFSPAYRFSRSNWWATLKTGCGGLSLGRAFLMFLFCIIVYNLYNNVSVKYICKKNRGGVSVAKFSHD